MNDRTPGANESGSRRRAQRTPHRSAGAHVLDYLGVIGSHWFAVGLVFLLVFGWLLSRSLLATPSYQTSATLQVDSQRSGGGGLLAELAPLERPSVTEAEIAVLLSYSLAYKAAEEAGLHAQIEEVHAYRPLEVLVRSFRGGWRPCRLAVETEPASDRAGMETWTLRFDTEGTGLTAWRSAEPQGPGFEIPSVVLAEPYEDRDRNGRWTPPEEYVDRSGNGRYDAPEAFLDADNDEQWDPAEPFDDANGNGRLDSGEKPEDLNGNGSWDPAEQFTDRNGNGQYDPGDEFEDRNGNGRWDDGDPYADMDEDGEYDEGVRFRLGEGDEARDLLLYRHEGRPAGKTFRLHVRTRDGAATLLRGRISAEEVAQWTGIVELTARGPTPHQAQRAANAVAESFLRLKQERRERKAEKLLEWLGGEIHKVRLRLRQLATARLDYIEKASAVRLGERATGFYQAKTALQGERFTLEQQEKQLRARLDALAPDQSTDDLLINVGIANVDTRTSALVQSLADLRVERAVMLREGATLATPQVKLVDVRIAMTQEELEASVKSLVTQRRLELGRALGAVQDLLARVTRDQEDLERQIAELPEKERKLLELAGPIQEQETALEPLKRWQQEAEIARASAVSSVYLVDSARLPMGRKSPSLFRGGLMALILGLVGGVGIAFLLEHFDRKVKSPQILEERLGLPIVVSVPAFDSVKRKHRGKGKGPLVALESPDSVLAEAYRTLRANIRYAHAANPIRTLAITSSMQQEGKTLTTLNLAVTMAKGGNSVVVVDADLRRPATHKVLGGEQTPGLVEVLRGETSWRDIVRTTEVEGFHVIAAGRHPENPGRLLDSKAFDELLAELKTEYEYVLFDVPPALAVADAAAFFRKLDAVLLLVRYGRYNVEVVEGAYDQLERLGADVLGVVFNGFDARRTSRYGKGYYGYYGHYARYAPDDA